MAGAGQEAGDGRLIPQTGAPEALGGGKCSKQWKEVARCDASAKRRTSKMCKQYEQDWLECAARTPCPEEHGRFARCWQSFLNSGGYQDPVTRVVHPNCNLYLAPLRQCVWAAC